MRREVRLELREEEVLLRPALEGDLEALIQAWIEVTEDHSAADPLFRLRADARPAIEGLIRGQLRDPDVGLFVATAAGVLEGFCCVRVDSAPPILEERRRAEITDLGVRPESRRRGVGRLLAGAALEWSRSRGIRRIEVRVAARNPDAQAFWRALEFADLMDVLHRRL